MENSHKSDVGVIGLAVMGENLVLNMENKGWKVSVNNRTASVTEKFIAGRAKGKNIFGYADLKSFVESLSSPRKIVMMVRAGKPVDDLMEQLFPYLSKGDILIDGGNSNFEDTNRRVAITEEKGLFFVGSGVSGGEEGALNGASIMPGGSKEAWKDVKELLQSISAKYEDGTPCCDWVGPQGSGHFVKMIHNGIEYGDMQLISEAYWIMKHLANMSNEEMANTFSEWNKGKLQSYLIEITAHILKHKDKETGEYLIDKILDAAGQKGTGKWSVINAMELGMPLGLISTAVFERSLSALKNVRIEMSKRLASGHKIESYSKEEIVKEVFAALYASKLISYAQGFAVLKEASDTFKWDLNLASIAKMWRGGCIIRSSFLNEIARAFNNENNTHLLMDEYFANEVKELLPEWKKTVGKAIQNELPVPAFSSALNYYYSLRSANGSANMIQAQRDYFGAHTFERTDKPRGEFYHENWTGHGGETKSGTYNV